VPPRWLAFVRFTKRGRRHQAAASDEAIFPEFGLHLVVARVGDAFRGVAVAQQDEPPAAMTSSRSPSAVCLMMGAMWPGKIAGSGSNAAVRLSDSMNLRASAARLVRME
jgi:hypothetical protein